MVLSPACVYLILTSGPFETRGPDSVVVACSGVEYIATHTVDDLRRTDVYHFYNMITIVHLYI